MGRNNQISSSAQRQATQLHQQSAMQAKTSTQSAPINQQLQKAPVRPASPPSLQAAQTQSKGQSQSAPMKQQQQNNKNAQVYRPSPVQEHPDDAFLSGAWMFDAQRVPQWLASQLPTAKRTLCSPKPGQQSSSLSSQSQQQASPAKQQQMQQQKKQQQQQKGTVIARGSVTAKNASPDDAFFSGAWLFDAQSAPQWLASQLPAASPAKQNQKQIQNNNNGQKRRPQSPGSRRA
ncbi:hypothetical protein BC828DRAFT_440893 [Blastocladiella britannica]|nr:hypothetical protein BC828DRAFT_440893 [Blastocladiella britannica]